MEQLTQLTGEIGVYQDSDGHYYVSPFWMQERFNTDIRDEIGLEYFEVGTDIILAMRLQDVIGMLDASDVESILEYGFSEFLNDI